MGNKKRKKNKTPDYRKVTYYAVPDNHPTGVFINNTCWFTKPGEEPYKPPKGVCTSSVF